MRSDHSRVACVLALLGVASLVLPMLEEQRVAAAEPSQQQAFDVVHRAVVRIVDEGNPAGHRGIGAIVTAEGHVVTQAKPQVADLPLLFVFPDGRRARGRLLGWSEEWNVSLAKITDAGPWPFVTMDTSAPHLQAKQPCLSVGYTLLRDGWKAMPEQRVGEVTRGGSSTWFSSSLQQNKPDEPYFTFGPVFDMEGKMLGTTANVFLKGYSDHLRGHQIQSLWEQLLEPGNLDKRRLFGLDHALDAGRPYQLQHGPLAAVADVEQRIVACTVELDGNISGVVISPDGWIATCGHGPNLPGDKVKVEFPDGRDATAVFTGTNPVSDIALAKIVEGGPWPFAPLAETTGVEPETPCWVVGYRAEGAADRPARQPLVRRTTIAARQEPAWSYMLFTTAASSRQGSGDSGGGVFDHGGRLLALHQGGTGTINEQTRVEVLRSQWEALAGHDPKK